MQHYKMIKERRLTFHKQKCCGGLITNTDGVFCLILKSGPRYGQSMYCSLHFELALFCWKDFCFILEPTCWFVWHVNLTCQGDGIPFCTLCLFQRNDDFQWSFCNTMSWVSGIVLSCHFSLSHVMNGTLFSKGLV